MGGFLWQEYNSLIYEHIILCILTIGLVGFLLDRAMSAVETRLRATVAATPGAVSRAGGETLNAGGKRLRPTLVYLSAPVGARATPAV